MRILFTSDLHALPEAYQGFSAALRSFDVGVIAGDLLDDYVADEKLTEMFNLSPDDFLEELPDPDATIDDRLEAWRNSPQHAHLVRGLEEKEREIKAVLKKAGKPVLVVRGNHDSSPLSSEDFFHNIHLRRLNLDGVGFVGFGWLGRELNPERQMDRFAEVEPLIDKNTILVTHCPPFGVLDVTGRGGLNYSIGSAALGKAVQRTRPRFHLFGHAHASAGIKGTSINGSYPHVAHFFGIDTDSGEVWIERDKNRPRPIWVQEAEDGGDAEELVDVETLERNQMRAERRKDMRRNGTWYHDSGEIADGRRFIALGRHEYYKDFAQRLSKRLGTEVYLLDFMIWLDLNDPHRSLLYFITAAERIDINLQGISKEDLKKATSQAGRLALDRRDLGLPYMTSWEINQLYWGGHLHKAWWHTGGSMTKQQAYEALGGKVPLDRIVEGGGAEWARTTLRYNNMWENVEMHIVLLGDSIFDNARYVPEEPPVVAQLQSLLPSGSTATLLAVDGSVTLEVAAQVQRVPREATHLVVSSGGNDALHASLLIGQSGNALATLADLQDTFRTNYRRLLQALKKTSKPTVMCTIYDSIPHLEREKKVAL